MAATQKSIRHKQLNVVVAVRHLLMGAQAQELGTWAPRRIESAESLQSVIIESPDRVAVGTEKWTPLFWSELGFGSQDLRVCDLIVQREKEPSLSLLAQW